MPYGASARTSIQRAAIVAWVALVGSIVVLCCAGGTSAAPKKDNKPPSSPPNLHVASATSSSVAFAWDASTDNVGVVGYDVYVGSAAPVRVTTLGYTVTGLACASSVSVQVRAVDAAENDSNAARATGSTAACGDTQPPSAPSGLKASVTAIGITLSWTASSDNFGVAGYDVYLGSSHVTTTSTSYVFTGLTCATPYTLAVDAYDAAGNTSAKTSISASTAACPTTTEPAPIAGLGYHQVFRDDFNTLDRTIWDSYIWYDEPPHPDWTNFQSAGNGILDLNTTRTDTYSGCSTNCYPIDTVTTLSSGHSFQYGYFEARLKWTSGDGAWPAFWLMSTKWAQQGGSCPGYAGEIDAFEGQGSEPNVYYGTVHSDSACNNDQQNGNNYQPQNIDLSADWHTYAVLWTSTTVTWYLDGQKLMSAATYANDNQPMFLLLDMWSGGWTRNPDNTTPSTLSTQVDYVQVWQK